MGTTVFSIRHDAGRWTVRVDGAHLAQPMESRGFDSQAEAVDGARVLAQTLKPSLVRLYGTGGDLETEWTFGKVAGSR